MNSFIELMNSVHLHVKRTQHSPIATYVYSSKKPNRFGYGGMTFFFCRPPILFHDIFDSKDAEAASWFEEQELLKEIGKANANNKEGARL